MKRGLLAMAALAVAASPVRAQVALPGTLDALLSERSRLEVRPGLSVLRCCAAERRLDARVRWPADPDSRSLDFALLGSLASTDAGVYSRSGIEVRAKADPDPVAVFAALAAGVGTGAGPTGVFSATLGAGVPALSLDVRTTWFNDAPVDTALLPVPLGAVRQATFDGRYTDGELRAQQSIAAVHVQVTGGVRFGGTVSTDTRQWLWGEVDVPVRHGLSVVLAGGVRPERQELAQVGGRFAQLAFVLGVGADADDTRPAPAANEELEPAARVVALARDHYLLRLRLPPARVVELTGDVSDWDVVPLRRVPGSAGIWEIVLEVPAGLYHFNIRLDGGPWHAPAGLPTVPDRFGGTTAILDLPTVQEASDAAV